MEKEIIKVLKYFSFFAYYPTLEEIYTFLQAKINKNSLNIELDRMVKQKLIVNCKLKIENYSHLCVRKLPRSGTPEELLHYEEIDAEAIIKVVRKILKTS